MIIVQNQGKKQKIELTRDIKGPFFLNFFFLNVFLPNVFFPSVTHRGSTHMGRCLHKVEVFHNYLTIDIVKKMVLNSYKHNTCSNNKDQNIILIIISASSQARICSDILMLYHNKAKHDHIFSTLPNNGKINFES